MILFSFLFTYIKSYLDIYYIDVREGNISWIIRDTYGDLEEFCFMKKITRGRTYENVLSDHLKIYRGLYRICWEVSHDCHETSSIVKKVIHSVIYPK